MIKFFILFCLLASFGASAADSFVGNFFSDVGAFFTAIVDFIFVDIPAAVGRFFVWLTSYVIYLKILGTISSVEFAISVTQSLISLLDLNAIVQTSANLLPNDIRNVAVSCGVFEGIIIIVEAFLTRLVYSVVS